jgi:hypothetical protein
MRPYATRLYYFLLIVHLAHGPLAGAQQAQIQNHGVVTTAARDTAANQRTAPLPDTQGPFLRAVFNTNADQGRLYPL